MLLRTFGPAIPLLLAVGCSSLPFFGDSVERSVRDCERGDAKACGRVGYLYTEGKRVERDPVRGAQYLVRACDGGDPKGCFNLAIHLRKGPEATRDAARARSVLEAPCAAGDPRSCGLLGIFRRDGEGGPVDLPNAVRDFAMACDAGDATACHNLGYLYWAGNGVQVDEVRSAELFGRACTARFARSCEALDRLESGEMVPRDVHFKAHSTIGTTTTNGIEFDDVASSCGMPQTILVLTVVGDAAAECAAPELSPRMVVFVADGRARVSVRGYTPVGTCIVRAVTGAPFPDAECTLALALRRSPGE